MEFATEQEPKQTPSEKWGRMFWACGGAMMIFFFNGVAESHTAVLLPRLQEPDSPIHINPDQMTWIASLGIVGAPVSGVLCGPCVDYFGRKIVVQCYFIVCALGYALIGAASSVYEIYVGRLILSLGIGFEVAGIVYIAEVSTARMRSVLLSLTYSVLYGGGTLFAYVVGLSLPWNLGSAVFALACVLLFGYESFTPESPPYLVKNGHTDEAIAAFKRLGRSDDQIAQEIRILERKGEPRQQVEWRTFLEPTVWKPFLIISCFHFLQAVTGVWDTLYYTVDLVTNLGTQYDPYEVSLFLTVGRSLMASTAGVYFTTRVSRKMAAAVSTFSMAVSLFILAVYEKMYEFTSELERPYPLLPICALIGAVMASGAGFFFLPMLMSGEVFPLKVRGTTSGAAFFVGTGSMFLFLKLHVFLVTTLGVWGFYAMWTAASFITGFYSIFVLTETHGRELHEIENSYRSKKRKDTDIERTSQF
nr:PREDICTED: facilitated trehalose transporter Tret1-like [Bemisia tabaci]